MASSMRDLVIAQIKHRETDAVPYTLGWEGDVAERPDYRGRATGRCGAAR